MGFKAGVALVAFITGVMTAHLLLTNCTTLDTPQQAYLSAVTEFSQTLQKYNDHYDALQSQQTKDEWRDTIDPLFEKVNTALDFWKASIDAGDGESEQAHENYRRLKTELLMILNQQVF
jgi:hypothetical protein